MTALIQEIDAPSPDRVVTVVILTFNEERHIARAIASVRDVARRIVVVDSYSTDRTMQIARDAGAEVVEHKFVNQARQFQWALDTLEITTPWILRLDADEVVGAELAAEMRSRLPTLSSDIVGIFLRRRHIWMGRWVRHGGRYPLLLLRLWRTGCGHVDDRWMDEHVIVHGGRTIAFAADFADENLNDIGYFIDKHNKYATREALEILDRRLGFIDRIHERQTQTGSFKRRLAAWVKINVYDRLPFTVSVPAYFLWRYVFKLGFLDGRTGLIYHFLQAYWYRFLVGAKVVELQRAVAHLSDKRQIAAELSRLTGQPLQAVE